jgi:hypothetical protein
MESKDNSERARYNKILQAVKRKKQKLESYRRNTEVYNERRRDKRQHEGTRIVSDKAMRARAKQEKELLKKEHARKRQQRRRNRQQNCDQLESTPPPLFRNRTHKHRSLQKLKRALPTSPLKRSGVIQSYILQSPSCENLRCQHEKEADLDSSFLQDVKEMIDTTKKRRTDDARAAMNILSASASGENISDTGSKSKLARKLGLPRRRLSGGTRIRTRVLHSDRASYTETVRKVRSDAVSDTVKQLVYDYWISSETSRPTGNKADVKRKRIALKTYVSHPIHVLEKSQTEVYEDFKVKYPDVTIGQRSFESLKPYFVHACA